jgi:uncharacterized protein (DUF433 family)
MPSAARTANLSDALDLLEARHEPVVVERDGRALAAVVPIDLYRQWAGEPPAGLEDPDELGGGADAAWADLPPDGAADATQDTPRRITSRADTLGGELVFEGTRIPVAHVGLLVRRGTPIPEILEDYPALHEIDVRSAAAFVRHWQPRPEARRAPLMLVRKA